MHVVCGARGGADPRARGRRRPRCPPDPAHAGTGAGAHTRTRAYTGTRTRGYTGGAARTCTRRCRGGWWAHPAAVARLMGRGRARDGARRGQGGGGYGIGGRSVEHLHLRDRGSQRRTFRGHKRRQGRHAAQHRATGCASRTSLPSAPPRPAPHGVSGLWVNLALHAREPLYWVTSTALGSSWRSQLFSHHAPPSPSPRGRHAPAPLPPWPAGPSSRRASAMRICQPPLNSVQGLERGGRGGASTKCLEGQTYSVATRSAAVHKPRTRRTAPAAATLGPTRASTSSLVEATPPNPIAHLWNCSCLKPSPASTVVMVRSLSGPPAASQSSCAAAKRSAALASPAGVREGGRDAAAGWAHRQAGRRSPH